MLAKNFLLFFLSFLLFSCSTDEEILIDNSLRSDKIIYNEAANLLNNGKYEEATELFTELDLQHPYSKWATKGQLMSGFALYKNNQYEESIFALSKFINLNPNHKDLHYAYYLRGYCYYERISAVTLDQAIAIKAFDSFTELINRFPNSNYSKKSIKHLKLLTNQLAGHEMYVGNYYQEKGNYLAGILRYKTILKKYKNSAQVPETIYRMIESYLSIGLNKQAIIFASILGYNYPKSEWYKDAFELMKDKKLNLKIETKNFNKKSLNLNDLNFDELN